MSDERLLVVDTETNGLPKWDLPADAEGQPRLAHLAMIGLINDIVWLKANAYIRPDGWTMTPETTAINGITDEKLEAVGIPVTEALSLYIGLIDSGYTVVAFNASFDLKMLRGELRRAGLDDRYGKTMSICPMVAATNICKLPKPSGKAGYKFPKLTEARKHFGLEVQQNQHRALGDAESCLELFRAMRKQGVVMEPRVPQS